MSDSVTPDQVQSLFNRIAPFYDELNHSLSLGFDHVWKQMAVKWANPQVGQQVLDLCCGSGDLTLLLAQAVGETGITYGVDFSAELLEVARGRSQKHVAPIHWVQADVLCLPFMENQFDAVTLGYGLRNVVDIPRCLREILRVLKPGAIAAILDFNHSLNPLVNGFQSWYLQNWVVPAAKLKGVESEYAYIMPSLERFPTGDEQVEMALKSGFTEAVHYEIALAMMGVLVIQKPFDWPIMPAELAMPAC